MIILIHIYLLMSDTLNNNYYFQLNDEYIFNY